MRMIRKSKMESRVNLCVSRIQIDNALLAHVSPMGWSHIGLTGYYLWEDATINRAERYLPLHDPSSRMRLVA
jgi:hypothetical protein